MLYVYMVLGGVCAALGAVSNAVKVFVSDTFQERHPFSGLNESDFGFQTVSSSCTTTRGTEEVLRKQGKMISSINTSDRRMC